MIDRTDQLGATEDVAPTFPIGHRLRDHGLFAIVLGVGAALRILTAIAYRPALLYIDSFGYLGNLHRLDPTGTNPIGYDLLLLRPVLWATNLASVAAVQHALGLGMGVALYLLVLRRSGRPVLAVLAAVPMLLSAYQLQIEQNVMS